MALLSRDFLRLVLVALATPVAWYVMDRWLDNYSYHLRISWWMFALAGGAALLIAFLTVSFQSVKAALIDPAMSLRSE
jgi:putative ABC transport system permease protein